MSRNLFIVITVITWLWTFFSFFYSLYAAQTGINPIMDWLIAFPSTASNWIGIFGISGIWAMVFGLVITWIIVAVIGIVIAKAKRK